MSLLTALSRIVRDAFEAEGLASGRIEVGPATRPEFGDFQSNGALVLAGEAGEQPRAIAERVAARLRTDDRLAAVDVAGPGFVNITLTDESLVAQLEDDRADAAAGIAPAPDPKTVVVDYAGPNVAKAMHVGHIRATIVGDALARLFALVGHRVIKDPHFGDWGFQMGLMITILQDERPDVARAAAAGEPIGLTLEDLQELYPRASARAGEDAAYAERARQATVALQSGRPDHLAVWKAMKAVSEESQRRDFADLGVEFDLWYGESDVGDRLDELVERLEQQGLAVESAGATVVHVAREDDTRELPPLILRNTTGGYLYSTSDLATIELRVRDLGADLLLYVVDARQSDHFEQVFRAARLAGILPDGVEVEHIRFGTMNGPDGRPFKTREGGVVRLGELIAMVTDAAQRRLEEAHIAESYPAEERASIARQVGIGALKYADLMNHRTSNYVFDVDRFTSFEGKTGPYLQYSVVRIQSILRKAEEEAGDGKLLPPASPQERDLVVELLRLPDVVWRAIDDRAPNHVAEYAYRLAGAFNRFYDTSHILSEPDPARRASWLALVSHLARVLRLLLDSLGIEVPDRM